MTQSATARLFRHFLRKDRPLLRDPESDAHRFVDGTLLLG
jgi:hypothetical protein